MLRPAGNDSVRNKVLLVQVAGIDSLTCSCAFCRLVDKHDPKSVTARSRAIARMIACAPRAAAAAAVLLALVDTQVSSLEGVGSLHPAR